MSGLGDTMRGNNSWRHIAPLAKDQEEQPSLRKSRQKEKGSWEWEEDPVAYFSKQDSDKMRV